MREFFQMFFDFWSALKAAIISFLVLTAAYFTPIGNFVTVIVAVSGINFLAGLTAGLLVDDEKFDFKKAFWCLLEAAVYLVIVASAFFIGDKMNDLNAVLKCIYGVTYAFIYFYAINILKNAKSLFPSSRAIRFLYFILSIEFIKKIPYMTEYLNYEKEVKHES